MNRHLVSILAALVTIATAASGLTLNLRAIEDLGCSPDEWSTPDIRLVAEIDGNAVVQSPWTEVQGVTHFAARFELPDGADSKQIVLRAEEREPSFLGLSENWVPCDIAPGPAENLTISWSGATTPIETSGDGSNGAWVQLTLGNDPPPSPQVTSEVGDDYVTLRWDSYAAVHHVTVYGRGDNLLADTGASSYTVSDLCEASSIRLQVVRIEGPWRIGAMGEGRTPNRAPPTPVIFDAQRNGTNVTGYWTQDGAVDLASFQIYALSDAESPRANWSLLETRPNFSHGSFNGTWNTTASHLVVESADRDGLRTSSEIWEIGSTATPPQSTGPPPCLLRYENPPGGLQPQAPVVTTMTPPGDQWELAPAEPPPEFPEFPEFPMPEFPTFEPATPAEPAPGLGSPMIFSILALAGVVTRRFRAASLENTA